MSLREDVLKRILSLDPGRSALLPLREAQEQVDARSAALLAIEGDTYVVVATTELAELDLARVRLGWTECRPALISGRPVISREWGLLPIGRPTVGLVYLGQTSTTMPAELVRRLIDELGHVLELALLVRHEEPESRLFYREVLDRTPLYQLKREKLRLALRTHGGNKARAAKALGITRATLYNWLRQFRLSEEA